MFAIILLSIFQNVNGILGNPSPPALRRIRAHLSGTLHSANNFGYGRGFGMSMESIEHPRRTFSDQNMYDTPAKYRETEIIGTQSHRFRGVNMGIGTGQSTHRTDDENNEFLAKIGEAKKQPFPNGVYEFANTYGNGYKDFGNYFYGSFTHNYGPIGSAYTSDTVRHPKFGNDAIDRIKNYSTPWEHGPHPQWPVPPQPRGMPLIYPEKRSFYFPDATPYDQNSTQLIGSDPLGRPVIAMDSNRRPLRLGNKTIFPWGSNPFGVGRQFTSGSTPYTGLPFQWSTSPYPYGNAGSMPGSSGKPEPVPFIHNGHIPTTGAGYASGAGNKYLHGGIFLTHNDPTMLGIMQAWKGNQGLAMQDLKPSSVAVDLLRRAVMRPPRYGNHPLQDYHLLDTAYGAPSLLTVRLPDQVSRGPNQWWDRYHSLPVMEIPPPKGEIRPNSPNSDGILTGVPNLVYPETNNA